MGRPALEVADIFRTHGPAWREAQRGHLSLGQLKVMSAITQCRTAVLGGTCCAATAAAPTPCPTTLALWGDFLYGECWEVEGVTLLGVERVLSARSSPFTRPT